MDAVANKLMALLAVMSEKERASLDETIEKIREHAQALNEEMGKFLDNLDRLASSGLMKTDVVPRDAPETLCDTCANPCDRAENEIVQRCPRYHQKTDRCESCTYYDFHPYTGRWFCTLAIPCQGGSEHCQRSCSP